MFLNEIKKRTNNIFKNQIVWIYRLGLTPNTATLISFIFTLIAIFLFLKSQLLYGGLALIVSYFFDILDGRIARTMKKESNLGYFMDKSSDLFRIICWIFIAMSGNVPYSLALGVVFTNAFGFFIGTSSEKLNFRTIKWLPCWIDPFILLAVISGYVVFFAKLMIVTNSFLILTNVFSIIFLNKNQRA